VGASFGVLSALIVANGVIMSPASPRLSWGGPATAAGAAWLAVSVAAALRPQPSGPLGRALRTAAWINLLAACMGVAATILSGWLSTLMMAGASLAVSGTCLQLGMLGLSSPAAPLAAEEPAGLFLVEVSSPEEKARLGERVAAHRAVIVTRRGSPLSSLADRAVLTIYMTPSAAAAERVGDREFEIPPDPAFVEQALTAASKRGADVLVLDSLTDLLILTGDPVWSYRAVKSLVETCSRLGVSAYFIAERVEVEGLDMIKSLFSRPS